MKIYISSKFKNAPVEEIVAACEGSVKSYKKDAAGREYFVQQTAPNILQKVYTEDLPDGSNYHEDWEYQGHKIHELSGNLEVEFAL